MSSPIVAKVGGSLFDLSELRDRLRVWLSGLRGRPVLLVPGGGPVAEAIRRFHQTHRLDEGTAHWLALRVLTVNAHFLAALLDVRLVAAPGSLVEQLGIIDAHAFCQLDEGQTGALEHSWRVTSDSIAARVAGVAGGDLVLLKSTDLPEGLTWNEASRAGLVDEAFATAVSNNRVHVSWVNLRAGDLAPRR